jgi:hypothetical protein
LLLLVGLRIAVALPDDRLIIRRARDATAIPCEQSALHGAVDRGTDRDGDRPVPVETLKG